MSKGASAGYERRPPLIDREGSSTQGQLDEIYVGEGNYALVTVPPFVWNGFKGIGEHSAVLRERICGALDWLGVRIDDAANRADASTISDRPSRVRVVVEPTNEEWIAASHAQRVIRGIAIEAA